MSHHRMISLLSALACGLALTLTAGVPAVAAGDRWVWPLSPLPPLVATFDLPDSDYGPGHRGVDLAGAAGQEVQAIGAGIVTFAARLAGRGVVVVDHGAFRSTYEPVSADVDVGEVVTAGDRIGTLTTTSSHCWPQSCLHLGVREGVDYVDPLSLLGPRPVRLKPFPPDDRHGGSFQAARKAPSSTGSATASAGPPGELRRTFGLTAAVAATLLLGGALRTRQARG